MVINTGHPILLKAIKKYTFLHQRLLLIEEMAELTHAILKGLRNPRDEVGAAAIDEEMADVYICLRQLRLMRAEEMFFKPDDYDAQVLQQAIDFKLKRLEYRMGAKC